MASVTPAALKPEEEIDLDRKWAEACQQFTKSFPGKKLNSKDFIATPDSIALQIRKRGEGKDPEKRTKWSHLGNVVKKLGQAVWLFAPMAGQIASMFFGPTQLALNAISFFVTAAVAYHKIYEDLKKLFERLAEAMDRFADYHRAQDVLANRVKVRANEILLKLVDVCELGHKLLVERSWVATAKRIGASFFFGDDQGVSDQLESLEHLAQVELNRNVIEAMVSIKRVEISNETDKQLPQLRAKLTEENQEELRRTIMMKAIPDAGRWIEDLAAYQRWLDLSTFEHSVLFLVGEAGCGKSILVSTIVDRILNTMSRRSGTKFIALPTYYYFDKGQTVDAALRAMSMQLARIDEVYRKELFTTLRKQFADNPLPSDVTELFKILFGDSESSTLVLLFDEVSELDAVDAMAKLLGFFMEQSSEFKHVKIIVSGRPNVIEVLRTSTGIQDEIDVASRNKDIQTFVRLEVEKLPYLQGTKPLVSELKEDIIEKLEKTTNFDYALNILTIIRDLSRPDDIRKVLKEVSSDPDVVFDQLTDEIDGLHDEDVRDLNTLLPWILTANPPRTCDELELILNLHNQGEPSLKNLTERISSEFSTFFKIRHDSTLEFASSTVEQYFRDNTADKLKAKEDAEKLRNQGEIRLIVTQLKNLFGQEIYDKYEFASLLEAKAGRASKLYIDKDQMLGQIALDWMKLADSSPVTGADFRSIKRQACYEWVYCLDTADVSKLDHKLLAELGTQLVMLLHTETERWLYADFEGERLFCFAKRDNMILHWLRQFQKVQTDLLPEQKEWLSEVLSPTSEWKKVLWRHVVTYKVKQWLVLDPKRPLPGGGELDVLDDDDRMACFRFVRGFLKYLDEPEFTAEDYNSASIPKEDIDAAAKWSLDSLGITEFAAPSLVRLAGMYQKFEYGEAAVPLFEKASQLDPDFPPAIAAYAMALFGQGEQQRAIQMLQSVISNLEQKHKGNFGETLSDDTGDHVTTLAGWFHSIDQLDEAETYLKSMYRNSKHSEYYVLHLFETFVLQQKYEQAQKLLDHFFFNEEDRDLAMDMRSVFWCSILQDVDAIKMFSFLRKVQEAGCAPMFGRELAKGPTDLGAVLDKHISYVPEGFKDMICFFRLLLATFILAWFQRFPPDEDSLTTLMTAAQYQLATLPRVIIEARGGRLFTEKLAMRMCHQYLELARTVRSDSSQERSLIEKVKDFSRGGASSLYNRYVPLDLSATDRVIGAYFGFRGNKDEAKKYLRPFVRIGLDLLSDNDPDNDGYAYMQLIRASLGICDDSNASLVFSLINRLVDAASGKPQASEPTSPTDNDNSIQTDQESAAAEDHNDDDTEIADENPTDLISWRCSANCGHTWKQASDLYFCRFCAQPSVILDKDCYDKLLAGDTFPEACNHKHAFFYVPPWDPKQAADLELGQVEIDGEIITIEEWKDRVRRAWNIPNRRQTLSS